MASRLLLALDETDPQRVFSVAEAAAPHLAGIKVNWPLLMHGGLGMVERLAEFASVICDLKVADIPNTARLIAEAAYGAGAAGIMICSQCAELLAAGGGNLTNSHAVTIQ